MLSPYAKNVNDDALMSNTFGFLISDLHFPQDCDNVHSSRLSWYYVLIQYIKWNFLSMLVVSRDFKHLYNIYHYLFDTTVWLIDTGEWYGNWSFTESKYKRSAAVLI